jgi:hypothetical protein
MQSTHERDEEKKSIKMKFTFMPLLEIVEYKPISHIPCYNKANELRIAIRSYTCNNKEFFLAVDPYTLATECDRSKNFSHRMLDADLKPVPYTYAEIQATPYVKALDQFTKASDSLENQGITEWVYPMESMMAAILTVDMCPSIKPFEAAFFESLSSYSKDKPTPVAICMTGWWMNNHKSEFNWLVQQQNNDKLNITWVNHTYSHIYYSDLTSSAEFENNFLLTKRTQVKEELMSVEKLLIKNYQCPSVFFRAPGLITNNKVLKQLNKFGLIPIGSKAWLAKSEEAHNGSIILVHGNSNEPQGIKKIMPLLEERKFTFFPLAQAFLNTAKLKAESKDDNLPHSLNL